MKKIFLLILLTTSIFASQFPKWYLSPPTNEYPSTKYFSSVYSSDSSFNSAIEGALAEIAKQIKADVKAKSIYMKSQVQTNDNEDIFSAFSSVSKVSSKIELKNFEIIKKEKKEDKYYVFVVIDKQKLANSLKQEITIANNKISTLYNEAENDYKSGLLENALQKLLDIKLNYPIIFKNYDILNSIGYSSSSDKPIHNWVDVNKKIISLLRGVKIISLTPKTILADVGEKIEIKFKVVGGLNQSLKVRTAFFKENSFVPFNSQFTDKDGVVSVSFNADYTQNQFKTVTMKLFTQFSDETIKSLINTIEESVQYKSRSGALPTIQIVASSSNMSDARLNDLKNHIENIFILNGFQIDKNSRNIVKISAEAEKLNGFTKTFKRVQTDVTISIIKDEKLLNSFDYSYIGIGKSLNQAYKSSFKNSTISQSDMEKIIGILK